MFATARLFLVSLMLAQNFGSYHFSIMFFSEYHTFFVMLGFSKLSAVVLSVVALSVIELSVVVLSVVVLSVVALSVIVLSVVMLSVVMLSVLAPPLSLAWYT